MLYNDNNNFINQLYANNYIDGDSEDFIFVQAKDENFTSENDEYESDEIYSSKDTHMMDFADRRSIPNT